MFSTFEYIVITLFCARFVGRNKKEHLTISLVSQLSYLTFFIINDMYIVSATLLISISANFYTIFDHRPSFKKFEKFYYLLIPISILTSFLGISKVVEVISLASGIVAIIGKRKNEIEYRKMTLISGALHLLFGILSNTPLAIVIGSISLIGHTYKYINLKQEKGA
ncbi:MAG: hypothetical protein GY909_16205 [Oligoflexia bacterium]|nr:hypothetical protein [Oligoflexia bacterium]